jgi:hypothetical protein
MKKHLLFLLVLAFSNAIIKAQRLPAEENSTWNNNDMYYKEMIEMNWLNLLNVEHKKIKRVESTNTENKKNNYLYELDTDGKIIMLKDEYIRTYLFFKRKHFIHKEYQYQGENLSLLSYFDKKGNVLKIQSYVYFAPNKVKLHQVLIKGKLVSELLSTYNIDSTIKEKLRYKIKNNRKRLSSRYEFDYYEDKTRKQTRLYNRKNKLKHTWNYDCNPKGEIQHAKQTNICKNTGTDSRGRLIETTFNSSDKNFKTKTVNTYCVFNQEKIMSTSEYYEIKKNRERKLYDTHYADSLEPYYADINYDKKGLIKSQWRNDYFSYNSQAKTLKETSFKSYNHSKVTFAYITTFTKKGLPLKTEMQNKKGRVIATSECIFYGDSLFSVNHFNKKHRLKNTYTTRISYH